MEIIATEYQSPFGILILASFGERLCMCDWTCRRNSSQIMGRLTRYLHADIRRGSSDVVAAAMAQLDEYFAGQRQRFDLPLLMCGTDFQRSVWNALLTLPYGTTCSYSDIASIAGQRHSVRATANAIGANAISIIIPCHRVIGSDGSLTGYAGGIETKRQLLQSEFAALGDDALSLPFDRDHMI